MSTLPTPSQPGATLNVFDFDTQGISLPDADVALVVQSYRDADNYLVREKWKTMWGESNALYQSPRAYSQYNGSYVLEPNVQRFNMARDVNAIAPQFHKGLFYEDPPFILRPGPDTTQEQVDAKRTIIAHLLKEICFERECGWALEDMTHQGTAIVEWGCTYRYEREEQRVSKSVSVSAGIGEGHKIWSDEEPEIKEGPEKLCWYPVFERCCLTDTFPDPKLEVPDISEANWVVRKREIDFYGLQELRQDKSYDIPEDEELKKWFMPGNLGVATPSQISQAIRKEGVVHTAQNPQQPDPNPLAKKVNMLCYWSRQCSIVVIDDRYKIRKKDNPYGVVPFLSANYWNCPNAMYGIGVGRLSGGDQRIDQGSTNTALKILAMKANAPYLRQGDANPPSQMIQTGLGRILTVADIKQAYDLLPTPDVPADLWRVLQDSRMSSESATGADSMLVQGSSDGRGRMSTKATGAVQALAGASATKLDGPLDRFITQIFIPFIEQLDYMIFKYMSDKQIMEVLGKKLGEKFIHNFDLDAYHKCHCDFDVLAGAKLAARAAMAQALILLFQLFENPQLQQNVADINDEMIDLKPLVKVALNVSQYGSGLENDIFKPIPPEKKQQRQAQQSGAAKLQAQMTLANQKFQEKQQLSEQDSNQRLQQDIVRSAFKNAGLGEIESGEAAAGGFGGSPLSVQ